MFVPNQIPNITQRNSYLNEGNIGELEIHSCSSFFSFFLFFLFSSPFLLLFFNSLLLLKVDNLHLFVVIILQFVCLRSIVFFHENEYDPKKNLCNLTIIRLQL